MTPFSIAWAILKNEENRGPSIADVHEGNVTLGDLAGLDPQMQEMIFEILSRKGMIDPEINPFERTPEDVTSTIASPPVDVPTRQSTLPEFGMEFQ
jgi:hypothetical protein